MREIKFRAWNGRAKQMAQYVTAIQMGDTQGTPSSVNVIVNGHNETWEVEHDKVELMQYTGMKDKNGNNIYEGDIVMWGDMAGLHEKPVRVAVVRFDPDICFDSNVGIFDYGNFAYKETDKYLTVIGNVYANPDLLEADK